MTKEKKRFNEVKYENSKDNEIRKLAMPTEDKDIVFFQWLRKKLEPQRRLHFKYKLWITLMVIFIYFLLYQIPLFGADLIHTDILKGFRILTGGYEGSIITLGLTPLIDAHIILILLNSAGIIQTRSKRVYSGVFLFITCASATLFFLLGFFDPPILISVLIVAEMVFGVVILYILTMIIDYRGLGDGMTLLIIAGISYRLVVKLFSPFKIGDEYIGMVPNLVYCVMQGYFLSALFYYAIPIFLTIALFFFAIYVIMCRMEIPLVHSLARGAKVRFPINILYTTTLPVIFTECIFSLLVLIRKILDLNFLDKIISLDRGVSLIYVLSEGVGIVPYFAIYFFVFITLCAMFSLWCMYIYQGDPKSIAEKLYKSGLIIPGFKRTPATLERMFEWYLPKIAIISGIIAGVFSIGSKFFNTAIGGTEILVACSGIISFYNKLEEEQIMEMHPSLRRFSGGKITEKKILLTRKKDFLTLPMQDLEAEKKIFLTRKTGVEVKKPSVDIKFIQQLPLPSTKEELSQVIAKMTPQQLNLLGMYLANIGLYEEALKCFDKALQIDPNYEPAKRSKNNLLLIISFPNNFRLWRMKRKGRGRPYK